jgi:DNA-damage-inducible protein D
VNDSADTSLFHFEETQPSFEDLGSDNGARLWAARDLMRALDYKNFASFESVINRAMNACTALKIRIFDHFREGDYIAEDGKKKRDYKLSRFACYLAAMNADAKKPAVARAQFYFATLAESVRSYVEESNRVERVALRGEVSEQEKTLSAAVYQRGVKTGQDYAIFQNAGYRGLYNMNLGELKERKLGGAKVKLFTGSLLDYMGSTELAANLFRVTQTAEKIKKDNIAGRRNLEETHEKVGKQVRRAMLQISGIAPEKLPLEEPIREVRKELKGRQKKLADQKKPRLPAP